MVAALISLYSYLFVPRHLNALNTLWPVWPRRYILLHSLGSLFLYLLFAYLIVPLSWLFPSSHLLVPPCTVFPNEKNGPFGSVYSLNTCNTGSNLVDWTLLREHSFCCNLPHVNIDKIQSLTHFASQDRFGVSAFQPAWGRIIELRLRLPKTVRYHGFTATCPPRVLKTIEPLLGTDYKKNASRCWGGRLIWKIDDIKLLFLLDPYKRRGTKRVWINWNKRRHYSPN